MKGVQLVCVVHVEPRFRLKRAPQSDRMTKRQQWVEEDRLIPESGKFTEGQLNKSGQR